MGLGWKERIARSDAKNGDRDIHIIPWLETLKKSWPQLSTKPHKNGKQATQTQHLQPTDELPVRQTVSQI